MPSSDLHRLNLLLEEGGSGPPTSSGIVGKLRPYRHGSAETQDLTYSFADATGVSSFTGTHWFCGATDYHERPAESEDTAGRLKEMGFAIIRSFGVLGYDWVNPEGPDVPPPAGSYFGLRGVSPVESHIERYGNFVEMLGRHGLHTQSTEGHDWNSHDERMRYTARFWTHMQGRGLLKWFQLKEGDNEGFQNAHLGNSNEQIREYKQIYDLLQTLGPDRPLFTCGWGGNEGPSHIRRWLGEIRNPISADDDDPYEVLQPQFCDYSDVHTSRDQTPGIDETIKRPFSLGYNEGKVGMYGVPFAHSEPRPYVGPAAFAPSDKPGRLFGCYGAGKLWGGLVTHFSGESVRGESRFNSQMRASNLLTAEGIATIVPLLNHLPRNVGESGHVPGGNIWWWALPDGRIATVVSELWPPTSKGEAIKAPVPVSRFLRIGPNWRAEQIEGEPRSVHLAGQGGALIIAERA